MRMAACGQTMAHLPHWMQPETSHTGISWARLRFSYFVVPSGNVPSHGMAETGTSSPRPAMISKRTSFTNWGVMLASPPTRSFPLARSEEHTSELQSRPHIVCRLLLEKKKQKQQETPHQQKKKTTQNHT